MKIAIGQRVHVKPRANLMIRDPDNRGALLGVRGRSLVVTEFWLRRIEDGDVDVTELPQRVAAEVEPEADYREQARARAREAHAQPPAPASENPPMNPTTEATHRGLLGRIAETITGHKPEET